MPSSFAQFAHSCPPEQERLVRELMAMDALCPASCPLLRDERGALTVHNLPSPLHWSRQVEWPWVLTNGEFAVNHDVLDIGGGWAVLKFAVAHRCHQVTVLELDAEAIVKGKDSAFALGFDDKVEFVQGDANVLPFDEGSFDRVLMVSVLEHVAKCRMKCLEETVRVLRPGGILLLTMDVRLAGECPDNFFVDAAEAKLILDCLGIKEAIVDPTGTMAGVRMEKEDVEIAALMVKWTKPEETVK